jgi:hypothetical protein
LTRKSKLKRIFQFYENLPVSDEIDFDEANTIQIQHPFLDKSNLVFPEGNDLNEPRMIEINKIMPTTLKESDKTNKSKNKRK